MACTHEESYRLSFLMCFFNPLFWPAVRSPSKKGALSIQKRNSSLSIQAICLLNNARTFFQSFFWPCGAFSMRAIDRCLSEQCAHVRLIAVCLLKIEETWGLAGVLRRFWEVHAGVQYIIFYFLSVLCLKKKRKLVS